MEAQLQLVYHQTGSNTPVSTTFLFNVSDTPGELSKILVVFEEKGINLSGIKSRPSHLSENQWEITVDVEKSLDDENMTAAFEELKKVSPKGVRVLGGTGSGTVPWFPKKIQDLDTLKQEVLAGGQELASDHPGFNDNEYRKRRQEITEISRKYKLSSGEPIPRIEYREDEIKTWGIVFSSLKKLYPTHACRAHRNVFPLLEKFCGYSETSIPQLQDISIFLQQATGWRLKPVTGLLTPRDFLNGLAFRVFHSTQYIRHSSVPLYTPEPDVCHELLGHVPLFADPEFAELSQSIGLASLGATDAEIEKLATLYWFTVEFGVCMEDGQKKAYGAGLLSSFGELEYCTSDKPTFLTFDPMNVTTTQYPVTEYQPIYFVATSFAQATRALREYAASLSRPFSVSYNPYTMSVDVLDSVGSVQKRLGSLQKEMAQLTAALTKI